MRTTLELPDAIYRRTEERAHARGLSVEQLIAGMLERELISADADEPIIRAGDRRFDFPLIRTKDTGNRITLPLIESQEPGTLDLSHFDFDDLLA